MAAMLQCTSSTKRCLHNGIKHESAFHIPGPLWKRIYQWPVNSYTKGAIMETFDVHLSLTIRNQLPGIWDSMIPMWRQCNYDDCSSKRLVVLMLPLLPVPVTRMEGTIVKVLAPYIHRTLICSSLYLPMSWHLIILGHQKEQYWIQTRYIFFNVSDEIKDQVTSFNIVNEMSCILPHYEC